MRPDPFAHDKAPERRDRGEGREGRAAGEVDRRELGEQGSIEAVDHSGPQHNVRPP
jgi:hypothetical protein